MSPIAVLDYGLGNLRSISRAVERAGGQALVTTDPDTAASADALLLPGVGSFGTCMRNLRAGGFEPVIREAVEAGRPVLGVCLGLQILFEGSEEADEPGLGILGGVVRRLPGAITVPHIGWNEVAWTGAHRLVPSASASAAERYYFVHSYAAPADGPGVVGVTEHGRPFAAAVAHGSVFATQFHPEKSGRAGLELYGAFVRQVEGVAA